MVFAMPVLFLILLLSGAGLAWSSTIVVEISVPDFERKNAGGRTLLGFKENPRGSNSSFECSPSGPCIPCISSEKRNEKYHCSETGYRIPFKCREMDEELRASNEQKNPNRSAFEIANQDMLLNDTKVTPVIEHRSLSDVSTGSDHKAQAYITYRSCVPASIEEKLSMIGFEGVILGLLLVSGTFIYVRRRRSFPMAGVALGRMPVASRF